MSSFADEQQALVLLLQEYWSLVVRDALRDGYVKRQRALRSRLAEALEARHRTTGVPLTVPGEALATGIIALITGLAQERIADPDGVPDDLLGELCRCCTTGSSTAPSRDEHGEQACVRGRGWAVRPRGDSRTGASRPRRDCFEAGSAIGGMWRYENDNGLSAAYASLTTNTSRRRMQYPSFPVEGMTEFPHHSELLAYLERYADANELDDHITCGAWVERARPANGGWEVTVRDAGPQAFDALVMASGHYWDPELPDYRAVRRRMRSRPRLPHSRAASPDSGWSSSARASPLSTSPPRSHDRRETRACPAVRDTISSGHVFGLPLDEFDRQIVPMPLRCVRFMLRAMLAAGRATPDRGNLPPPAPQAVRDPLAGGRVAWSRSAP